MISSLRIPTAVIFLAMAGVAFGQGAPASVNAPITLVPNTIEYIPPLAQAVLSHDREQVNKMLENGAKVDETVKAKGARAGFTPLILAAAFS
jgi:hypothetical protein